MYKRIAQALLESVFYRISAIVSLDERKEILGVSLFSTDWPEGHLRFDEHANEICLISHHPEGCAEPYEQDERNFLLLCSMAKGAAVRLFLASEYFECFEAER